MPNGGPNSAVPVPIKRSRKVEIIPQKIIPAITAMPNGAAIPWPIKRSRRVETIRGMISTLSWYFKCTHCSQKYEHVFSLFQHQLTHKEVERTKCTDCEQELVSEAHRIGHRWVEHSPIKCTECCLTFGKIQERAHHLSTHSGEASIRCGHNLSCHMCENEHQLEKHKEVPRIKCPDCEQELINEAHLDGHRWLKHSPAKCVEYGIRFDSVEELSQHTACHTGDHQLQLRQFRRDVPNGGGCENAHGHSFQGGELPMSSLRPNVSMRH